MTGKVQMFFKKLKEDENFRAAFESAATTEAKAKVLAEAGLDISVKVALEAVTGQELSDEDLDAVAGGGAGIIRYPPSS
jgi:predicted ribosomally synthesized peptide with nif11-like leader